MFSTWGDIMSTLGHVQYIRGIIMKVGDTMCTLGDVQYIRENWPGFSEFGTAGGGGEFCRPV